MAEMSEHTVWILVISRVDAPHVGQPISLPFYSRRFESNSLPAVPLTMNKREAYLLNVQHHACIDTLAHYHSSLQRNSGIMYFVVEESFLPTRRAQSHTPELKEGIVKSEKTCTVWLITDRSVHTMI